jgi:hypothetical protein
MIGYVSWFGHTVLLHKIFNLKITLIGLHQAARKNNFWIVLEFKHACMSHTKEVDLSIMI